ncbi:MAG TPA: hypothetical protein VKG23_04010 [Thermoanaerobaculia bacterium]|nr:hypothetical protein [Thermoanaerobaculia bacterium]
MLRTRPALSTALAAVCAGLWLFAAPSENPVDPSLSDDDRVRVAEAFRLAERIGDQIWPGWARVRFALVLVTPDTEFFIRHPSPPADARSIGEDARFGSNVFARPRTFPTTLLATFPIDGVSTVVVGQPGNTGSSSPTDWVVTVLHEHFHQLQESQPGFLDRMAALGLARGDTTGMWMLNFPFPYARPSVAGAYRTAAFALRDALRGGSWPAYLEARAAQRSQLSKDDLAYFDFQLWKEGVARYTQLRVAEWAAEHDEPSADFRALPGFVPYATLSRALADAIPDELTRLKLPDARRNVVYPYGAAEALLLDRMRPCWKDVYFTRPFTLAPGFDAKDCGGRRAGRG